MEPLLELTQVLVAVAMRSVAAAAAVVSLPQFRALLVLERVGPCNAGGLAEHLGTHASTVTRICDRLVALGHVSRELQPGNRRSVALDVTPAGRALVRAVRRHRARELGAMLSAMEPAEREQLTAALPSLLATADAQHGELPEGWAH